MGLKIYRFRDPEEDAILEISEEKLEQLAKNDPGELKIIIETVEDFAKHFLDPLTRLVKKGYVKCSDFANHEKDTQDTWEFIEMARAALRKRKP